MAEIEKDNRGLSWGVLSWQDYAKRPHERVAAFAYVLLALLLFAVLAIAVTLLLRVLFAAFDPANLDPIKSAEDFNKILLGLGGLIGAVTAVPFLVWRTLIAQKQNVIAQENLHSTTMAKAIEQLGAMKEEKVTHGRAIPDGNPPPETITNSKPNIEVRLGAIYLLEKLAREHKQLHWPIMEILCAYVRENAGPPRSPPDDVVNAYRTEEINRTVEQKNLIIERGVNLKSPRVDVQSAITVIGRRSSIQRNWERELTKLNTLGYQLDLSNCHLSKAEFSMLQFSNAKFNNSSLEFAKFMGTYVAGTEFIGAHLEGASLYYADLRGTHLFHTHLEEADLSETKLNDAFIDNSDLRCVKNITQDMFNNAWGNKATFLPIGIKRPINERWVKDEAEDASERNQQWHYRRQYWLDEAANWTKRDSTK